MTGDTAPDVPAPRKRKPRKAANVAKPNETAAEAAKRLTAAPKRTRYTSPTAPRASRVQAAREALSDAAAMALDPGVDVDEPAGVPVPARNMMVMDWVQGYNVKQIRERAFRRSGLRVTEHAIRTMIEEDGSAYKLSQDDLAMARARSLALIHLTQQVASTVMLRAAQDDAGELALKAIDRLGRAAESEAKLLGLNVPVRYDATLTVMSKEEAELQEIINEAKAQAAALEGEVIRQASEDPDL